MDRHHPINITVEMVSQWAFQATNAPLMRPRACPTRLATFTPVAPVTASCQRTRRMRSVVVEARNKAAPASTNDNSSSNLEKTAADAANLRDGDKGTSGTDTGGRNDRDSRLVATASDDQRQNGSESDTTAATSESSPAQLFRQQRDAANQKPSFVQRVWGEVGLIEWPSIPNALLSTGLVILIVVGSSVVLFVVNLLLSEGFQSVYSTK